MTVFGSAVEVVEQYVAEIRPCFGAPRHPAMFLTERGTRIALAYINVALLGAPNLTAMNARSGSETRVVAATTSLRSPKRRPESRC